MYRLDLLAGNVSLTAALALQTAQMVQLGATPESFLKKMGFEKSQDKLWSMVVGMGRYMACFGLYLVATTLYFWYYNGMPFALHYALMVQGTLLAVAVYRAFFEDTKSGNNSEATKKAASGTVVPAYGTCVFLMAVSSWALWMEFYNGSHYTTDSKHGLPEELTLVATNIAKRFLTAKQHLL